MNQKTARQILFTLLALCAIIPAIKQLREPDVWWMLATGEYILNNGIIPKSDVFSFTHYGVEWVNVKWGFEVVLALVARIGGPEFTLILQAIVNLLLLLVFAKWWKRESGAEPTPWPPFAIAFILLIFSSEFRMNGRPEMISHLFTGIFITKILLAYRRRQIPWILIPLQVLWTNLHEAYGTGQVIATIALAGSIIQFFWLRKNEMNPIGIDSLKRLALLWIGIIVAPALHPWGLRMIIHPYEIFTQVGANKFTTELVGFRDALYWQKEAWLMLVVALLALVSIVLAVLASGKKTLPMKIQEVVLKQGMAYLLLVPAFFYLALTAYRNIPFFIIAAFPLILAALVLLGNYLKPLKQPLTLYLTSALALLVYILFASGFYYKKMDDGRDRYGLAFNETMHPAGAAEFLKQHPDRAPVFSDFLVANYLLWAVPDFKTYLDLRDLDIFPASFFNRFAGMVAYPDSLFNELERYQCRRAVLLRNGFVGLHYSLANSPDWHIVFADPVAVVWEKSSSLRLDSFRSARFISPSAPANLISKIFNPLYQFAPQQPLNVTETGISYLYNIGLTEEAVTVAAQFSEGERATAIAWQARINLNKATRDTGKAQQELLEAAVSLINKAAALSPRNEIVLTASAEYFLLKNDLMEAQSALLILVKEYPKDLRAWSLLADIQVSMAMNDPANQTAFIRNQARYLQKAVDLDPSNEQLTFYLGIAYGQTGNCKGCIKYIRRTIDAVVVPENDRALARDLLRRCSN